jgi:hypothetical protein
MLIKRLYGRLDSPFLAVKGGAVRWGGGIDRLGRAAHSGYVRLVSYR